MLRLNKWHSSFEHSLFKLASAISMNDDDNKARARESVAAFIRSFARSRTHSLPLARLTMQRRPICLVLALSALLACVLAAEIEFNVRPDKPDTVVASEVRVVLLRISRRAGGRLNRVLCRESIRVSSRIERAEARASCGPSRSCNEARTSCARSAGMVAAYQAMQAALDRSPSSNYHVGCCRPKPPSYLYFTSFTAKLNGVTLETADVFVSDCHHDDDNLPDGRMLILMVVCVAVSRTTTVHCCRMTSSWSRATRVYARYDALA